MAPDISADTGPGAAACAGGSQTCNGASPALDPAPITTSTSTATARVPCGGCARIESNDSPSPAISPNAATRHSAPSIAMPRYSSPARLTASSRCPVITSTKEASDIASNPSSNITASCASRVSTMPATNTGSAGAVVTLCASRLAMPLAMPSPSTRARNSEDSPSIASPPDCPTMPNGIVIPASGAPASRCSSTPASPTPQAINVPYPAMRSPADAARTPVTTRPIITSPSQGRMRTVMTAWANGCSPGQCYRNGVRAGRSQSRRSACRRGRRPESLGDERKEACSPTQPDQTRSAKGKTRGTRSCKRDLHND